MCCEIFSQYLRQKAALKRRPGLYETFLWRLCKYTVATTLIFIWDLCHLNQYRFHRLLQSISVLLQDYNIYEQCCSIPQTHFNAVPSHHSWTPNSPDAALTPQPDKIHWHSLESSWFQGQECLALHLSLPPPILHFLLLLLPSNSALFTPTFLEFFLESSFSEFEVNVDFQSYLRIYSVLHSLLFFLSLFPT